MHELKQAQKRRLRFIEFLLLFKGQCSRADLVKRFGISEPAGTKDFSEYSDRCPENLRYDVRAKRYVIGDKFDPAFEHSGEAALRYLSGMQNGILGKTRKQTISAEFRVSLRKSIDWVTVAPVTRAIAQRRVIGCEYTSMSSGSKKRILSPHSIIHDGIRWHFRAYEHEKGRHQDYNFNRVSGTNLCGDEYVDASEDTAWNTKVNLQFIVHPNNPEPRSIEQEYEMVNGVMNLELRCALVGYYLRSWLIDFSINHAANYRAYQLALNNRDEVLRVLEGIGLGGFALEPDFLPDS